MLFFIYLVFFIIVLILALTSKNQIKQIYTKYKSTYRLKQNTLRFKPARQDENSKALSRKKLFKQTNLNQGYNKQEALNLDSELDKFKIALNNEITHKYSKNMQVLHSTSAFASQNLDKKNLEAPNNVRKENNIEKNDKPDVKNINNINNANNIHFENQAVHHYAKPSGKLKI